MKKRGEPVIRCLFSEEGASLAELLEEAFRLYLERMLAADGSADAPAGQ